MLRLPGIRPVPVPAPAPVHLAHLEDLVFPQCRYQGAYQGGLLGGLSGGGDGRPVQL